MTQQHNFSSGTLTNSTPHFTPSNMQNGTPANVEDEIDEPISEYWQEQLQLAAESRQANSPHYYARTIAQQSKGIQIVPSHSEIQDNGGEDPSQSPTAKENRKPGWMAIDFGGQGLRALSTALFNYKFLDKLFLSHNKLKTLPPAIGQLRNLTFMDLSGNELTELPEEIGMLTNLRRFLLFDNNVQTLPYEMGYLYSLEILGIEGNPLDEVLKSHVMKQGTKALIKYLKEEMPGKTRVLIFSDMFVVYTDFLE
jgi:CCR4-NOT transcription complex subunit 6